MVLVSRSSEHALRFTHFNDLKSGRAVPATFSGVHTGQSLGRKHPEQRRYEKWRYTESALGDSNPVIIRLDGSYIFLADTSGGSNDLVFDVSFWNLKAGNTVNFVGGTHNSATRVPGTGGNGGRCFVVNSDGTISPSGARLLCLGAGVEIDAEELEGCYACGCFPCGSAIFGISPKGRDDYSENGVFFWLFVAPIPYFKRRRREKGTNTFVNRADPNDRAAFYGPGAINPGPLKALWGGRICK